MPRPTLRRTVSTPAVRQRASSNPYPPMSPVTTRSMAAAMNSAMTPSASSSAMPMPVVTRSRRGNSTSSSSPAPSASDYWSRRVLADITWCYDPQLAVVSSESETADGDDNGATTADEDATTTASDNINLEEMERLSLGASSSGTASIVEEDESIIVDAFEGEDIRVRTPEPSNDPFAILTNTDSQPSSTNSSPARPGVSRSVSLGGLSGVPAPLNLSMHGRRESSYSSISSCSDFEDLVPSPSYL